MKIVKTKRTKPIFACLYGSAGIGKSSFGASAPKPFFIQTEPRLSHIDADATELLNNWDDTIECLSECLSIDYETIVVDSIDNCERWLFEKVARSFKAQSITEIPHGRGYSVAYERWREIIVAMERLVLAGKNVIVTCHDKIETFTDPTGENFHRFTLALSSKPANELKNAVDYLLCAQWERFSKDKDPNKVIGTGARYIYTQHKPEREAKFSGSAPERLPLSYPDFFAHTNGAKESIELLKREIAAIEVNSERGKKLKASLARAGNDVSKLSWFKNQLLIERNAENESRQTETETGKLCS